MSDTLGYQNQIAFGFENYSFPASFDLFGGESNIVTDQGQAGGADIPQFAVLGRNAALRLVPLGAAGTPEGKAVAIAAQPIKANQMGPIYTGGTFNHEALRWPVGASHDTLAERKAAFDGTNIGVRKLL